MLWGLFFVHGVKYASILNARIKVLETDNVVMDYGKCRKAYMHIFVSFCFLSFLHACLIHFHRRLFWYTVAACALFSRRMLRHSFVFGLGSSAKRLMKESHRSGDFTPPFDVYLQLVGSLKTFLFPPCLIWQKTRVLVFCRRISSLPLFEENNEPLE